MRIINGKLLTMEGPVIENGYIEWQNGIISLLGNMDEITPGPDDYDAHGGYVLPGFVDAHTCIGLKEESHRYEGVDWNEESNPLTPDADAFDGFNPLDYALAHALRGGVTTAVVSPGNTNLIGGQAFAAKLAGKNPAAMVVKRPCAVKFSLGEDPKNTYAPRKHAPVTRMAELAMLREILGQAKRYEADAPRKKDRRLEALLPLLRGEIPAYIHANRADDIVSALRLAEELSFRCVIVHGAESPDVAEELKAAGTPVIVGSLVLTNYSYETRNAGLHVPAQLWEKGVPFCITSDHHMSPIEYLSVCAALSIRFGLPEEAALRAITIDAARIAELDQQVGSLHPGKDADIAVFNNHPFSYDAQLHALFVGGTRIQ